MDSEGESVFSWVNAPQNKIFPKKDDFSYGKRAIGDIERRPVVCEA